MHYYKDLAKGVYPLMLADKLDDPAERGLVEITADEYEEIRVLGYDHDHPLRHEVRFSAEMAEALKDQTPMEFEPSNEPPAEPGATRPAVIKE